MTGQHCWKIGDMGEFCDEPIEWVIRCERSGAVVYSCDKHVSKFVLDKKDNEHLHVSKLSDVHVPCLCRKCVNG